MRPRRAHERGQVAVYAVVLFPLLVLVMSLVYVVGNVEDLRSRIRARISRNIIIGASSPIVSLSEGVIYTDRSNDRILFHRMLDRNK